ncbi:unnamed protein product [Bursaphelenchus xylophilus]|nr:unnamed protein product [Bursaphelenchus xylophilus]CAG9118114.1 unnamed protein product [Bursaphelenchus xylophilus]
MKPFSLLFLLPLIANADLYAHAVSEARKLLDASIIPNVTIRECSCDEQSECLTEMKMQMLICADNCWGQIQHTFKQPDDMKQCVLNKSVDAGTALDCVERNVESCLREKSEIEVPKHDIEKGINLIMAYVKKSTAKMSKSLSTPIQRLIKTAETFTTCLKTCFVAKNKPTGFCFDRKQCQPKIDDKKVRSALKSCMGRYDWKQEAGEMCECTANAGVSEVAQFCRVFKLMGTRERHG